MELVETLAGEREADLAAAVARHEVDRGRRHLLRRDRQVPFVLAIGIVDDDHHAAGADLLDRVLDAREWRLRRGDLENGPPCGAVRSAVARPLAAALRPRFHFALHL